MKKLKVLFVMLFCTMILWVGCDPATNPNDAGTPLWTLHGSISSADGISPEGELRVAFLWINESVDYGVSAIAQDLPIQPEFPTTFSIELFGLPPEEAMLDGGEWEDFLAGSRIATGILVVYEDVDGDGELDLASSGDPDFIDIVHGASFLNSSDENYVLLYLESDSPIIEDDDLTFEPGMNLFHERMDESRPGVIWVEMVPLDTAIEIQFSDDPSVRNLACEEFMGSGAVLMSEASVDPTEVSSHAGADFSCSSNGRSVSWGECTETFPEGVCIQAERVCTSYRSELQAGDEPPEGWPCPM